jgi:hypothetical protein
MTLYSYKGEDPSILPLRIRLDDGTIRTSLEELSVNDLKDIGFIGPITKPLIDENIEKIEWSNGEYQVIQLTEEEISIKNKQKEEEKMKNIDYGVFWELVISSSFYKKIRLYSIKSNLVNVICTEMIGIFSDAKGGNVNMELIQKYINIIFLNINFLPEEVQELQSFMDIANLSAQYIVPDSKYLSSHTYDPETNTILGPAPFASWTIVNGEWKAPVNYPTDGGIYKWDEDIKNWVSL